MSDADAGKLDADQLPPPGVPRIVDRHCTAMLIPETGEIELTLMVTRRERRISAVLAEHAGKPEEEWLRDVVTKYLRAHADMTDEEREQERQKSRYEKQRRLIAELDEIDSDEALYHQEYVKAKAQAEAQAETARELSAKTEAGYLATIAALAHALSDCRPELQRDGRPFIGYSKDTGDAGIVGHLKQYGYSTRSTADLERKLSTALKQAKLS